MPKKTSSKPSKRRKKVVVIIRLYCSPDPQGPKYEQYCQQKLVLHVPFRHQSELRGNTTTFTAVYASFLQSGSIPSSPEDDIHRIQQLSEQPSEDEDSEVSLLAVLCISVCTVLSVYLKNYLSYLRIRVINIPTSDLARLWKSGCSSVKAALIYSWAWSARMAPTGPL